MCPSSYSLTSQRTQTLLNSGRKWVLCYNVWHTAVDRPPWSPCPSKLMETNVSLHENVSWKNGHTKIQKDGERKWSKSEPPIYHRHFKVEKRDVSKNACVLPVPWTCTVKMSSTESITSLSRAVFLVHAEKRNIKSQLLSFPSIFFCPAFESSHLRGKAFSYFWLWRHVRGLGVSALFSGARHFLLQMKTKIHPLGWIINNTHAWESQGPQERGEDGKERRKACWEEIKVKGEKGYW